MISWLITSMIPWPLAGRKASLAIPDRHQDIAFLSRIFECRAMTMTPLDRQEPIAGPIAAPTPSPISTAFPSADVDAGDSVRARIHFLVAQNNAMVVQTQFADAKAAALMTLMGLVALRGPLPLTGLAADPLALTVLGLILFSILCCLWAVMPRFRTAPEASGLLAQDKFTWTVLSAPDYSAERHGDFARLGDFDQLMNALSASNVGGARVLRKKFRSMRIAFVCAIVAIVIFVVRLALPVGAV